MKAFLRHLFIILISTNAGACQSNQSFAPGFDFVLFDKTPVQKLAQAVEAEDTALISKILISDRPNIDFQEPRFGETLLSLAIMTNKVLSIEQLLKLGANPNIKSPIDDKSPFIDFCFYSSKDTTSSEVLKTLIKYGGDVNAVAVSNVEYSGRKVSDTITALQYVCTYGNLATLKVLVDNGAKLDIYPIEGEESLITNVLLADNFDMLKYFLIEKQLKIPSWCFVKYPGQSRAKKLTITEALTTEDELPTNAERNKLKQDILDFLKAKQNK
jgi:uncharacterized protein